MVSFQIDLGLFRPPHYGGILFYFIFYGYVQVPSTLRECSRNALLDKMLLDFYDIYIPYIFDKVMQNESRSCVI